MLVSRDSLEYLHETMNIVMYTQFSHVSTFLRAFVSVTGGTKMMVWREEILAASLHFRPSVTGCPLGHEQAPRTWLTPYAVARI